MPDQSQSKRLRKIQADMQELYDAAMTTANASQAERLGKSIANLTKQIKEQEIHEREVLERDEVVATIRKYAIMLTRLVRDEFGEQVIPVLEQFAFEVELLAEAEIS